MTDNETYSVASDVADEAIDYSAEEGAKEISSSVEDVKRAALAVLQAASMLQDHVNSVENLRTMMQNQTASNDFAVLDQALELQKSDIQSKEQYEFLMEQVFLLQNEVNAFLGQKVQMVYVYKGAKGEVELWSIDNSVKDLSLTRGSSSHGGYFSGRYQLSRKKLTALGGKLIEREDYDPIGLNLTYQEILRRKQYSKEALGKGGTFIILWNEGNGWQGVKVSSEGVLAESYAGFYLNGVVFEPGGSEANVRYFMTDTNLGVIAVDNASGFLQGDISIEHTDTNGVKSSTEYGIKTKGASAMGYIRIIQEAKNIYQACLEGAPTLTTILNDLKATLKEEGKVKLAEKLSDNLDPELDELLKKLVQQKYTVNLTT